MATDPFWNGIKQSAPPPDPRGSGYDLLAFLTALIGGSLYAISGCLGLIFVSATGGFLFLLLLTLSMIMLAIGLILVVGAVIFVNKKNSGAAGTLMFTASLAALLATAAVVLDLLSANAGIDAPLIIRLTIECVMLACTGTLIFALTRLSAT
jgi:hypothetical protein